MIVFLKLCLFSVSTEWEAVKNAESAKEAISQSVSVETSAGSNTQTETFNQQVAMMPVQVMGMRWDETPPPPHKHLS